MSRRYDETAFPNHENSTEDGLSKLEYFAGVALQGLLSNPSLETFGEGFDLGEINREYVAKVSIAFAKSLIDELGNK